MNRSTFVTLLLVLGCGGGAPPAAPGGAPGSPASAPPPATKAEPIAIDGSSTVHPITEAVAEEFQRAKGQRVTIGVSGTGGGFKKLCAGEVAVAGASRPIKDSEIAACQAAGIEWIELPVAYDGLAVVVHPSNELAHITVAELKALWAPEAQGVVTRWSQVRAGLPNKEVHLFGAGVDSGTYDYFTQAIVGKEHSSRGDYTSSEDDHVLVQGVSMDPQALGFFGLAYLEENKGKVRAVAVDDGKAENGAGPVLPSAATVVDGTYQPLSRPLFIYVSKAAAGRAEVKALIEFYLQEGRALVGETGYVPLSDKVYELVLARFRAGTTGSLFTTHGSQVGAKLETLLGAAP